MPPQKGGDQKGGDQKGGDQKGGDQKDGDQKVYYVEVVYAAGDESIALGRSGVRSGSETRGSVRIEEKEQ